MLGSDLRQGQPKDDVTLHYCASPAYLMHELDPALFWEALTDWVRHGVEQLTQQ
jgi:hypothetical protein